MFDLGSWNIGVWLEVTDAAPGTVKHAKTPVLNVKRPATSLSGRLACHRP